MKLSMADLQPRVEKGAAWLDTEVPEWFNRVKVDKLNMESCLRCVLGQSCGYYFEVINRVDPEYGSDSGREGSVSPWAIARGFALDEDEAPYLHDEEGSQSPEWRTLRECWITAILERRFTAADPVCAAVEIPIPVVVRA